MTKIDGSVFPKFMFCGLILVNAVSCSRSAPTAITPREVPQPTSSNPIVENQTETASPRGTPLFDAPQFALTDQNGDTFGNKDLDGRIWIVNFMYTRCQATSTGQTERLAELQTRIGKWPHGHRVRFLSITVDPEFDTSARLREYAEKHGADSSRWKFLTGPPADLWRLSQEGFKLPVADNSDDTANPIAHSSRFVLVDAQGRARGEYESFDKEDILKLLSDTQLVLSEPVINPPDPIVIGIPDDIFDPTWLETRGAAQLASAATITAYHDFQFVDRIEETGIQFVNRSVADVAKDHKMNHYDHANGVAAADVDGDGLIDLYFTSQRGGNQLWRNTGNGHFEDITEAASVGLKGRVSVAASFADTDNDGDPDLYVTTTRHGNAFLVNDGKGRFQDWTTNAGLEYSGHSSTGVFFDYDRDGRLDLLLTNVGKFTTDKIGFSGDPTLEESPYYVGSDKAFGGHMYREMSEQSILYHNEGANRFRDVSDETGLKERGWSGDATPIDANRDGWTDLYVLNMQGNDVYYQNLEGKRFEDRSHEMFPNAVWGGMGAKSFDYNNDGLMDLYVTNMHADMWQLSQNILGVEAEKKRVPQTQMPESYLQSRVPRKNILGSALYVAEAAGGYSEIATEVNADNYWPWGPSVGDLNADGYQDLFIASCMNFPYRYHVNSVLINDKGQSFRDAEFILGIEPRRDGKTAAPLFELDCSGADADHRACEGRSGHVTVWGSLGTRSAAIFDLDRDGDLDIVTNDFNSPPMVLISNLSERNPAMRYIEVQLRGTKSSRNGLGALVQVSFGDQVQTQVYDGQSGYLSHSLLPLYFGLGTSEVIDKITVRWPDGSRQIIQGPVAANQAMLITEE